MNKLFIYLIFFLSPIWLSSQTVELRSLLEKNKVIQSAINRSIDTTDFNRAIELSIMPIKPISIDIRSFLLVMGVPGINLSCSLKDGKRLGGVSDLLKPNGGDTSHPFFGIVFYYPEEVDDPDKPNPWSDLNVNSIFEFRPQSDHEFYVKVGHRILNASITRLGRVRWLLLRDNQDRLLAVTKIDDVPMIVIENKHFKVRFLGPKTEARLVNAIYRVINAHLIYTSEAMNCFG